MDVDPSRQWQWHEAHRDAYRNQYRTTYTDMSHGRETSVKSEYPSGYGGHIPTLRFDVLFRNTAFDRNIVLKRNDPSRDAHPSFKDQLSGIPTFCSKPQGAKKNPSFKVVNHDGSTNPLAPWGVLRPVQQVPSFRNCPATMTRARSLPSIVADKGAQRQNRAAPAPQDMGAFIAAAKSEPKNAPTAQLVELDRDARSPSAPLKDTVFKANTDARNQVMPSEQEMLMEEVGWD